MVAILFMLACAIGGETGQGGEESGTVAEAGIVAVSGDCGKDAPWLTDIERGAVPVAMVCYGQDQCYVAEWYFTGSRLAVSCDPPGVVELRWIR
jgi:hypothetical protein